MIYKFGDCPSPEFDFERFAESCKETDYVKWPCIIGEWYLQKDTPKYDSSILAQVWEHIIKQLTIPYDLNERRKKLAGAYKELKHYIDDHIAMKLGTQKR